MANVFVTSAIRHPTSNIILFPLSPSVGHESEETDSRHN